MLIKYHRMKTTIFLLVITLVSIQLYGSSKNNNDKTLTKDSVWIDSVKVKSEQFLQKLSDFYSKSISSIDTNSFLYIFTSSYPEDTNCFTVYVGIENDLVNELMTVELFGLFYFMIDDVLVLVKFSEDNEIENLLFKRTTKQRKFTYTNREFIKLKIGHYSTRAAYEIRKANSSKLKIKKLYYMKYPASRIRKLYYRLRYWNHFIIFRRK